jgi:hypothetical protein
MLDRDFWLKELMPVHVLVLGPDTVVKTFARGVRRRAEQRIGRAIPRTLQDEEKLRLLRGELGVQEPFGEKDCLDRVFHLLQDGEVVVDHPFNDKVIFLLDRLIE